MTDPSESTTKPRQVRVPTSMWEAWEQVCARRGTTRAERVLDALRADVEQYGTPEEKAMVAEGERELAERRGRMHPGRPRLRAAE